jgi:16S rRNA processing protein RimM
MGHDFLQVGKIVSAQGLKGAVRVYPMSDFPERFLEPGRRWLLRPGAAEPQAVELTHGYYLDGKNLYVLEFEGISDRTAAEGLKNYQFMVLASDRPQLEAGEFHVGDLIGLEVFDQATQSLVGTVINLIPAGNDLLEVERIDATGKKTAVLIPFVQAIVPIVDLTRKRIEITPPLGLIE